MSSQDCISILSEEYGSRDPDQIFETIVEIFHEEDGINYETIKIFFETFPQFINSEDHRNPLIPACCTGNIELVEILLDLGFRLSDVHSEVLHMICECEETPQLFEMIKYLIRKNVPLDLSNQDGYTPLMVALLEKNVNFAAILLEYRATSEDLDFGDIDVDVEDVLREAKEMANEVETKEPDVE